MNNVDYVVIGAGLTGLTTAYELIKKGYTVRVVEKENRCGGFIRSEYRDGFLFERGPNSGVFSHPDVPELLDELGEKCNIVVANEKVKNRFILKEGRWHKLPLKLSDAITTPLFTVSDKLRLLVEPFKSPKRDRLENLEELILRRLGKSFLEYAIDPFIGGIYAGDPSKLVPKYALPKMFDLEQTHGSFIKAAIKRGFQKRTPREKRATRAIYSCEGGIDKLTTALFESVGSDNIILNAGIVAVTKGDSGFCTTFEHAGETIAIASDNVISTIPGNRIKDLFVEIDPELFTTFDRINYARVIEIALGFKEWNFMPLDGFGGLIPFRENRNLLGVLFLSSCFENRAPDGGALLTAFVGGVRHDYLCDLNDDRIIELLEEELTDLLDMENFSPDLVEIMRHEQAIPQYDVEQGERLDAIDIIEQQNPGLYILGNIRDGIGMADRIKQAREFVGALKMKGSAS